MSDWKGTFKKLKDKAEGATDTCGTCGQKITCRMSNYHGKFPDYLQWQNKDGSAHFASNGFCRGAINIDETCEDELTLDELEEARKETEYREEQKRLQGTIGHENTFTNPLTPNPIPDNIHKSKLFHPDKIEDPLLQKQEEIKKGQETIELKETKADAVAQETILLLGIKKQIEKTIKELNITAEPQEIGMYTKEIYKKIFGSNFFKGSTK